MRDNQIRMLVMDVDGTLTDGKLYYGEKGELFKVFDTKDGTGIYEMLRPNDIIPVIITGRESEMVKLKYEEIGVEDIIQGCHNKLKALETLMGKYHLSYSQVAYIGDDINDCECMRMVSQNGGAVGCPLNAAEEVKEFAGFISSHNGGDGAVRDFIEWIVNTDDLI